MARVRKLSRMLDSSYRLPGTEFRFGLDPLIGLVPGIGDAAGLILSIYPILEARRHGVRRWVIGRMAANVVLDATIGAVPLIGDAFDFAFKTNRRNLRLLEREMDRRSRRDRKTAETDW